MNCHCISHLLNDKDRLTTPLMKQNGNLVPISWEEAVSHAASSLRRIIDEYGPDSFAFLGGASNLVED